MAVAGNFSGTLTLIGDISCKGITVGGPVCLPARGYGTRSSGL